MSLGKGFYHVLLNSDEKKARSWARDSFNAKPGIVRLPEWELHFNPVLQKLTSV